MKFKGFLIIPQLFYRESGLEGETSTGAVADFDEAEKQEIRGGNVLRDPPNRPKVLR